jgi:hypothetical protein
VIGPLIDMRAGEKVEAHIADAVKKRRQGGHRRQAGRPHQHRGLRGSFFEPTVLTDVTTDMVITKEETFGPVAPLYRFKSEAEAIKMANDAPTLTLPRVRGREGRGSPPISTAATSAASGAVDHVLVWAPPDYDDSAASAASAARRLSRSCSRLLAASAAAASNAARASS